MSQSAQRVGASHLLAPADDHDVRDRQHAHLHRCEPGRQRTAEPLDEKRDEALVRAERRAMNAKRHGPTAPCNGDRAVLAVRSRVARCSTSLPCRRGFVLPRALVVDVLAAYVARVAQRQAKARVVNSEEPIYQLRG